MIQTVISPMLVTWLRDGIHWMFMDDWRIFEEKLGLSIIKKGFPTDWGSVPRAAQGIISSIGLGAPGYAWHDWNYAAQIFSREECDDGLRRIHISCGMPEIEANIIRDVLELSGWEAWDRHAKNGDSQHIKDGRFDLLIDIPPGLLDVVPA